MRNEASSSLQSRHSRAKKGFAGSPQFVANPQTKAANAWMGKFDDPLVRRGRRRGRTNGGRLRKRSNEQNHPPPLLIRKALFERRHGLASFRQLKKELAVGNAVHVPSICKIRWLRIVKRGVVPVATSRETMANRTFVAKDRPNGVQIGCGRRDRVLQLSRRLWNHPRPILKD